MMVARTSALPFGPDESFDIAPSSGPSSSTCPVRYASATFDDASRLPMEALPA